MIFRKNGMPYLYFSLFFLTLLIAHLTVWVVMTDIGFDAKQFVVAIGSAGFVLVYLRAFMTVKEISISDDHIAFLPNGFKLDISDIETIDRVSFRNISNVKPTQLFLRTRKKQKFKWIPGSFMRADQKIIISLFGLDGEVFVQKLEAVLSHRSD